ncbi:hypothetical protein V1511DRAFT_493686 [Dipodascopsis uninucleata]
MERTKTSIMIIFRALRECTPRLSYQRLLSRNTTSAFVSPARRYFSDTNGDVGFELSPALLQRAKKLEMEYKSLTEELAEEYDVEKSIKQARLERLVSHLNKYENLVSSLDELKELAHDSDPALREDALTETEETLVSVREERDKVQQLLVPPHPFAAYPCILELRPGIGGAEASIFAKNLLDMYMAYANSKKWKTSLIALTHSSQVSGGITEAILAIEHPGAYERLQFEGGVHRVQRIPETESKGRVHTSTAAIVVLPQIESNDDDNAAERSFDPGEVRIDVMRARGAGGQHVNTTDSAVRLTHLPTGIIVSMQDNRSQHKNKAKAFMILRARLAEKEHAEQVAKDRQARDAQVTSTDRSDKLRTYNYPQNRVTDHRCGFSMFDLEGCMRGESLDTLLDKVHEWATADAIRALIASSPN